MSAKKMGTLIIVSILSAICIVSEGQTQGPEGDPELEAYLREVMENFREEMKNGIPSINVPVLDPLALKNEHISVQDGGTTLDLYINEILIQDLSKFSVDELQISLDKYFIKLSLTLPEVRASGKYKLDGKIVKILPLYGEGDFQINLTKATVAGYGRLMHYFDTLQVKTLDLDLQWEKLTIDFENLLGGSRFAQVLQKIIPVLGKSIFDKSKPDIMKEVNTSLERKLNKSLDEPKIKDLIKSILFQK